MRVKSHKTTRQAKLGHVVYSPLSAFDELKEHIFSTVENIIVSQAFGQYTDRYLNYCYIDILLLVVGTTPHTYRQLLMLTTS